MGAAGGMLAVGPSQAQPPKAPFKVLFNNDSTNLLSCVSPYHAKGDPVTTERIQAMVDEAAEVDAHLLMPGMGWAPWWPSKVLPLEDHHRWFEAAYGMAPRNAYHDYLLAGGDVVQVFVDRCRERGVAPFISFRLNDGHHLEHVDEGAQPWNVQSLTQFYKDHPEYRIGPDVRNWNQHVQNWAIPEVRAYKYAFIEELCENYDLDGFELDFMRHCSYFDLDKTTSEQRRDIMTGFVGQVRKLLDRTAGPGQHRWLSARVPCRLDAHDRLGIDLKAMAAAGLDMVNLSPYYFTQQETDLPAVRALVPGAAVYLEMTHATVVGPAVGRGYDNFSFRRTTDDQFYTAAHKAYAHGADGMSLFNFVYYREHGTPGRGPFGEPPFHIIPRLKDPAWLARQPQWNYLSDVTNNPSMVERPLKRTVEPGKPYTFTMTCFPTDHLADGVLRLMTSGDSSGCAWAVKVNGAALERTDFVAKPIEHPHDGGLGQPEQYACFACPRAAVKKGANALEVTMTDGDPATVIYIDLVLPLAPTA